jgi:hypothetical protein
LEVYRTTGETELAFRPGLRQYQRRRPERALYVDEAVSVQAWFGRPAWDERRPKGTDAQISAKRVFKQFDNGIRANGEQTSRPRPNNEPRGGQHGAAGHDDLALAADALADLQLVRELDVQ